MTHYHVTAENLTEARESCAALDQRKELEIGCETWAIHYSPGHQRGQMTAWPHKGRAAVMHGGDSVWGDWDPNARTLICDDGLVYDENGEIVPADPDC